MPEIADGGCFEVQGSATRPYIVRNVGGVYSCSCPAWRNQSLSIERRSCKHLRRLRGDAAEEARVGAVLPMVVSRKAMQAPPLLLAETWDGASDPKGWFMSEKLDGVRGYWDGRQFLSRTGHTYVAPEWFTAGLPLEPLDGELWIGRKQFQRTVGIVRRHDATDLWDEVRFVIFDAPASDEPFESRLELIRLILDTNRPPYAVALPHHTCRGAADLQRHLSEIESGGGEGVMLRQPGSRYEAGRSGSLQKVKRFQDAEARVVGHEGGRGRHKGRLGALLVELTNGTRFAVGTGLSDAERLQPPPVGSIIKFRYQEFSDRGVPRFPSYVGLDCENRLSIPIPSEEAKPMAAQRRFEFIEGTSSKFWEVSVDGTQVTVQFGRIGTSGQTETKGFRDAAAATKHAEKKVKEKLNKGYEEV